MGLGGDRGVFEKELVRGRTKSRGKMKIPRRRMEKPSRKCLGKTSTKKRT